MWKLLFIFLCITTLSGSANEKDSLINRIFNCTYNQEFKAAELLLQNNKAKIDELYFMVLSVDLSYWKNVTGTDHSNYKEFENTLEKFKPEIPETFHQKVIQLILLSYQLRYELKRYKIFKALFTLNKTKLVYTKLQTDEQIQNFKYPELLELYNSMFSYFDNYLNPFSGESSKERCNQAIVSMEKLTHSEQNIVKTLANYFLGKTYLNYTKEPEKGIANFSVLSQQYPNNKNFVELKAECENKLDK